MAQRRATAWVLLAICGAVLGWELIVPVLASLLDPTMSEFEFYAVDKLGFAAALAACLSGRRLWRRCGFAGGLQADAQVWLWPLWLVAAFSAMHGFADTDPVSLVGWLAISAAVGFGEEGVFRGAVIATIGGDRPRCAAVVSSILFGALHLAGLLAPVDARYILLQAAAAMCLGLVLSLVRLLAGSIWPGIIAHAALDFFGLAASGSVSGAMEFSASAIVVAGAGMAVSLAWAAVLWRRLPQV